MKYAGADWLQKQINGLPNPYIFQRMTMSKYEAWLSTAPPNLESAKLWKLFVESNELTQSERWQEFNHHFNRIHCPDKWRPYTESKTNFLTQSKGKKNGK